MHAPHISDGFPSFDGQIAGPFYCWADILQRPAIPEAILEGQWDESLDCLAQFCIENGPFDGVYGFSQGALLVTNFSDPTIWKDRFQMEKCPWNFAILACGAGGNMMTIGNDTFAKLPSFHLLGEKDPLINQSEAISKCWDPFQKVTHTHDSGHEVDLLMWTRETELMASLYGFLNKCLSLTLLLDSEQAKMIGYTE